MATYFWLMVIMLLKHYIADYLLQNRYMLNKFKSDWSFVLPLLAHSGVHGVFTLAICLVFAPALWYLALIDMAVHFIMDRIKASPKLLGRYKALSGAELGAIEADLKNEMYWVGVKGGTGYNAKVKVYKPVIRGNTYFWWALGFDQLVHHLTDLIISTLIVMHM